MRFLRSGLAFCVLLTGLAAAQTTVSITPSKDNTMFSENGTVSNGKGVTMFSGRTLGKLGAGSRRCLVAFNVRGAVPKGSKIVSAQLKMTVTKTVSGAMSTSIHRVGNDWGEGNSNAGPNGGRGALAQAPDATWTHRMFNTVTWTTAGGDFARTPSATTSVGGLGTYTFGSTTQMVADVQSWLDKPQTSFGWIVITNETVLSAKQWASRENSSNRPTLIVQYTPTKATVVATGTGCNNLNGRRLVHAGTGLPQINNAAFGLNATNGTPNRPAIMFLTLGQFPVPLPLPWRSCKLYVNITALLLTPVAIVSPRGRADWPFPIPNANGLIGLCFDTQATVLETDATLTTANALTVTIGT